MSLSSATRHSSGITIQWASICAKRRSTGWLGTGSFAAMGSESLSSGCSSRAHAQASSRGYTRSVARISSTIWKRCSPIRTFPRRPFRSCSPRRALFASGRYVQLGGESPRCCSMDTADPSVAAAATAARALLGGSVEAIDRVQGAGRNSRIYSVRRGSEHFAVKHYPSPREDPRERLKTEVEALRLMERNGISGVPRSLASDAERGYALLSWIEGEPLEAVDEADIDAAVHFLGLIHQLRRGAEAER